MISWVFVLSHCTLDDDLTDYHDFQPRLVVNGDLSPQQGVYLKVSVLLDPKKRYVIEDIFIEDAMISVFDAANALQGEVPYNHQLAAYVNKDLSLQHNQVYSVEVRHQAFPTVNTSVQIPRQIENFQAGFEEYDREIEETHILVSYDELDARMYYRMFAKGLSENIITYPKDYPGQAVPDVSPFFCNRNFPLFYDNSCQDQNEFHREVDLWMGRVRVRDGGRYDPTIYIYDSLELVVESITPIYKEYGAFVDEIPEDLDLLFAEQRRTPTNIVGGYGIVAGKSIHSLKIYVP